jgi:GNAT superfamily N-acetyltransferase
VQILEQSVSDKIDTPQAGALLLAHWNEIARNKDVMRLDPMVERYEALEKLGLLIGLFAYDEDELVGYCVSIVNHGHLHYRDLITVSNDVLFVQPEYRGAARVGYRLMRETERLAKDRGAHLVLWHAKEHTALASMLPRMGYEVQDIVYSRRV